MKFTEKCYTTKVINTVFLHQCGTGKQFSDAFFIAGSTLGFEFRMEKEKFNLPMGEENCILGKYAYEVLLIQMAHSYNTAMLL
jgi:hypothetical protein